MTELTVKYPVAFHSIIVLLEGLNGNDKWSVSEEAKTDKKIKYAKRLYAELEASKFEVYIQ